MTQGTVGAPSQSPLHPVWLCVCILAGSYHLTCPLLFFLQHWIPSSLRARSSSESITHLLCTHLCLCPGTLLRVWAVLSCYSSQVNLCCFCLPPAFYLPLRNWASPLLNHTILVALHHRLYLPGIRHSTVNVRSPFSGPKWSSVQGEHKTQTKLTKILAWNYSIWSWMRRRLVS